MTQKNRSPGFLRDGERFMTNNKEKADSLNNFFQSVFSPNNGTSESYQGPIFPSLLNRYTQPNNM